MCMLQSKIICDDCSLKCSYCNRIEDEEWDKYIIPSKVESEKYKVSRTFSFLKSRMSSTRNKTKVRPLLRWKI